MSAIISELYVYTGRSNTWPSIGCGQVYVYAVYSSNTTTVTCVVCGILCTVQIYNSAVMCVVQGYDWLYYVIFELYMYCVYCEQFKYIILQ